MKNKIVTILLSALIIISVGGNIYLLNQSKTVSASLASATTELNNLSASITEKDNLITEANTTISELETTIADLQSQITTLTETVSALETENQELLEQKTDPEVDGTTEATPAPDTDGDSFDDALIDAIIQDALSGKDTSVATTPGRSTPEADALLEGKPVYDPNDPSQAIGESTFGQKQAPEHLQGAVIQ